MGLTSVICLAKLIKNWSRSFCINCRYLGHYLTVISMWAIVKFSALTLLCWTYLLRRSALGSMRMIPIFSLASFVRWSSILLIALINISDSVSSKHIWMIGQSISITCVKSVSSELLHFAMSHLFCFFYLSRVQLHLRWIDWTWATCMNIWVWFFSRFHITIIIIVVINWRRVFAAASLSVLLSNPCF